MMAYREDKTTQAAALFLSKQNPMTVKKLMKLLYIIDRSSLIEDRSPISFDLYCSMQYGPVLSKTYDAIKGESRDGVGDYWRHHIRSEPYGRISLQRLPPEDALSERDRGHVNQVWRDFGGCTEKKLIDYCHENFKEWNEDVGASSTPISREAILEAGGRSAEDVKEIVDWLDQIESLGDYADRTYGTTVFGRNCTKEIS